MVTTCCICGVESNSRNNRSFHRIPQNESMKCNWIKFINKEVTYSARVCSDHFLDTDFVVSGNKKRLLSTACPSIKKDLETDNRESANESIICAPVQLSNAINANDIVNVHDSLKSNEDTCTDTTNIDSSTMCDSSQCSSLLDENHIGEEGNENVSCNIGESNKQKVDSKKRKRCNSIDSQTCKRIRLQLSCKQFGSLSRQDFKSHEA